MATTNKHANAVMAAAHYGDNFLALANNPAAMQAYVTACEVDRLTKQIADDSAYMAERYADFSRKVAAGYRETDPGAYSTARDITENTAKLYALAPVVVQMLTVLGPDVRDAYLAALKG